MGVVSINGYEVMVLNVSREEKNRFQEWLDDFSWGSGVGWILWPSKQPDRVSMVISSSFSGTWVREILPELISYWGEERIIHEVTFEEDM